MTWTSSLNAALRRSTGLRLTRETPEQRAAAIAEAADAAMRSERQAARKKTRARVTALEEKHARQLQQRKDAEAARRAAAQAKQKQAAAELPAYFDDEMRQIITTVRPRTMTDKDKLEALISATRYVARHQVPGDIVECGVWRGGSMQAIALTLAEAGVTDRDLHLFDTYEGMPPPTEEDVRTNDGRSAEELLAANDLAARVWAYADLDDVRAGMAEVPYPAERVHFHVGLVEDTIPENAPERIALLRLDTDWYQSTKHELDHLYDRLSPGGILIFDDYGHWDGARQAIEEWQAGAGSEVFLAPMASGRIGVKPLR